ncbi:MAG: hypothetical protein H0X62_10790 [Bacteroidetes bacterium]|nr:hypothetical protein [Bacteroidota bacterium]
MRLILFISVFAVAGLNVLAQKNNNQGGILIYTFGQVNGILDSTASNPKPNEINPNSYCIKYRRSKEEIYDNIKLNLKTALKDVSSFSTYEGNPPKIKMKVYSTAPVGTQIEIQLGRISEIAYPDGIHSQYQGFTSKQNEWEEIEFLFAQIPEGSKAEPTEIDQVTILFAPKSETNYVFYYDGLSGPILVHQVIENE